jgi:uncharacterized protein (TIRG00374 family)
LTKEFQDKKIDIIKNLFSLRTLLGFAVGAFIIYFFLRNFELDKALTTLSRIKLHYFLLAGIVYYSSLPIRGWRWGLLMRPAGIEIETKPLAHYYFLSWFANSLLPARIGDIYRAYLLKKNKGISISMSIGVLFSERIFDLVLVSSLVIISGSYYWGVLIGTSEGDYLIFGLMAVLLLLVFFIAAVGGLPHLIGLIPERFRDKIERFRQGLFRSPRQLPVLILATLAIWLSEALRLFLVLQAFGVDTGFFMALFVSQASLILMAVPLSPAGLGIVELLMLKVMASSGLAPEMAGAITIADRIISYWSLLAFGAIAYILSPRVR